LVAEVVQAAVQVTVQLLQLSVEEQYLPLRRFKPYSGMKLALVAQKMFSLMMLRLET
jgi:hypothetical protein